MQQIFSQQDLNFYRHQLDKPLTHYLSAMRNLLNTFIKLTLTLRIININVNSCKATILSPTLIELFWTGLIPSSGWLNYTGVGIDSGGHRPYVLCVFFPLGYNHICYNVIYQIVPRGVCVSDVSLNNIVWLKWLLA